MLQRTQLMLDQETKQDLLWLSRVSGRSMSEWVREFVVDKIKVERKKRKKVRKINAVKALLEMAREAEKLGPSNSGGDLSVNLDHYLYGAPKRK